MAGRMRANRPRQRTIDFAHVVRGLQKANYSGLVGVEYAWIEWEHGNEGDNRSETILLRELLRKSMRRK